MIFCNAALRHGWGERSRTLIIVKLVLWGILMVVAIIWLIWGIKGAAMMVQDGLQERRDGVDFPWFLFPLVVLFGLITGIVYAITSRLRLRDKEGK